MKHIHHSSAVLILLFLASIARAEGPSPAELKINAARRMLSEKPQDVRAMSSLAMALAQRARETGNPDFYDEAEKVVEQALILSPANFESEKALVWIWLGKHEFTRALELARMLNKRMPDDVLVYSLLTDACIETGRYDEAEKAAQWALDMRPGEIPGLTRASYLRELFGDIDGAIELMQSAYVRTVPTELEDRAWILAQVAHLQLLNGQPDVAEKILDEALRLFPGYHYALGNLVKVHTAQRRLDDAVAVARDFYQAAPHPENLFVVGESLARAGQADEARKVFAEFEERALAESKSTDNANRELAFYFADHAGKPGEALRIAKLEIARRQDVHAMHAYAWALHVNGKSAEAREQIEKSLAVGIRDPAFSYHAGVIAAELDDREVARRHLEASLAQAPNSEVSDSARRALLALEKPSP